MPQDKEHEIRLQFLEESQDYLNSIESALLGLSIRGVDSQRIDAALRAAHSIKGGAAMMGFQALSHLAHRLEDFFKILKVGKYGVADEALERLLLAGVDQLRQVVAFNQQNAAVEETGLAAEANPTFDQLYQRLGDPQTEDAATFLSEEAGEDIKVLLFETEVEGCLQRLEAVLANPQMPCLQEEFLITAQELSGLGQMLELHAFSSLCESVIQHLQVAPEQVEASARFALQEWRRSQALVLIDQVEALPTQLDLTSVTETTSNSPRSHQVNNEAPPARFDAFPLVPESIESFLTVDGFEEDALTLVPSLASVSDQELPALEAKGANPPVQLEPELQTLPAVSNEDIQKNTIRVSVKQLDQLADLLGQLTIERNGLDLHLGRFRHLIGILSQRVQTLEKSNFRLRTAYDKIATQATVAPVISQRLAVTSTSGQENGHRTSAKNVSETFATAFNHKFDLLEMDRYSDLHLPSQEVMETIVQIQEVTNDIEINLEDTEHTARELTRTSKQMQTSITQVRMRPFADLVGHFPRSLRNLALEYGKNVELKVRGGDTLIDRTILEALSDPLLHLLRNAFDHGIEDPATRQACGKPEQGVIEISAAYRGNQTVITVGDDGRGINLDKIQAQANHMGLNTSELTTASNNNLLELIFEPGFSTAEQVTNLSGRGLGMDIVRTNLQQVRGEIQVDTQPGLGTTFTIVVPFTLSVVRILLVESDGMLLAFPTDAIEEMLLLKPEKVLLAAGKEILNWEGYMVPLIRLSQWLQFSRSPKVTDTEAVPTIDQPTVLMIAQGNDLVGLQVERYWGEQEVTIRQVEGSIEMPPGFTGCTILGDGRVVPLVDVMSLLRWIDHRSQTHRSNQASQNSLTLFHSEQRTIQPLAGIAAQSHKNTVMVVDDSINVRRFLALTLEKAGYRVEQAKDGQDALEKLQGGLPVQAVICDIEMPRLDGYGFLAHVKSNPAYKSLPVIMLTSRSGEKHRQLAINLGARSYFSKPFREQELLQTLKQLIQTQLLNAT
jgi:chemosensory pili system protein ChpA (sensor histidine kinase/response regulator)